jgi:hypothetical protein
MVSSYAATHLNTCGTRLTPFPLAWLPFAAWDAHCESQAALTHSCSSHPSRSQERSSGPSVLPMGNLLVHWAATRGLLGNSGAALSFGQRGGRCCSWWPSGGCCYMDGWFGYDSWLSPWLAPVLGQALRGKLRRNGGRCTRPCAATGALRRAPPISTLLGVRDRLIYGMKCTCGDKDMWQSGNRSRVGSCGGRGNVLQPAARLCSAAQRDQVRMCRH